MKAARSLLAALTCLGWLAAGTSAARADTTAPADAIEQPPEPDAIPSFHRSPALTALAACDALLARGDVDGKRLARCFEQAAQMMQDGVEASAAAADANGRTLLAEISDLADWIRNQAAQDAPTALRERVTAARVAAAAYKARSRAEYSLVSQGGVSLGNWQAGFLYLLSEYIKAANGRSRAAFRTVAGASAGAINGLVAASAGCERANPTPASSLFYKIWIPLGLLGRHGDPGLMPDADGADALGVFSTAALDDALLRAHAHLRGRMHYRTARCHVDYGLSVTHLSEKRVPIHTDASGNDVMSGLSLRESFALELEFASGNVNDPKLGGVALRTHNLRPIPEALALFEPPSHATVMPFPLLGTAGAYDAPVDAELLMKAVQASGAFPVAFPPVQLPFRRPLRGGFNKTEWANFVDGGVFDNTPLGLAVTLDTWRLRRELGEAPRAPATTRLDIVDDFAADTPRTYVLVDPNVIAWTTGANGNGRETDAGPDGLLDTYVRFAARTLGATQDAALVESADRWPFVREVTADRLRPRLAVPKRHLPIAGAQLGHFMAFVERDFREFDFYVGMADAVQFIADDDVLAAHAGDAFEKTSIHNAASWKRWAEAPQFTCMLDYYGRTMTLPRRITGEDLPASCKALGAADRQALGTRRDDAAKLAYRSLTKPPERHTSREHGEAVLAARNFNALLVTMHNFKRWTRSGSYAPEREDGMFLAELQRTGFRFLDLSHLVHAGDTPLQAGRAQPALRRLMQRGIDALSEKQPTFAEQIAIGSLGRVAADQYQVLRPRFTLGLGYVSQGVEVTAAPTLSDAFRIDFDLRAFRIDNHSISADDNLFKMDAATVIKPVLIVPLLPWVDLELGLGATGTLTFATEESLLAAARAGPHASAGVGIVRRVYLELEAEYFPVFELLDEFEHTPVPIVRRWRINGAVGWRWIW
jgi:hypothetical protein